MWYCALGAFVGAAVPLLGALGFAVLEARRNPKLVLTGEAWDAGERSAPGWGSVEAGDCECAACLPAPYFGWFDGQIRG